MPTSTAPNTNQTIRSQIQVLALSTQLASAVETIEIKGSDFINSATGNRFQLIGVAYQPGESSGFDPASGIDPLSDGDVCLRDAALMQRLGASNPEPWMPINEADGFRGECYPSLQPGPGSQP